MERFYIQRQARRVKTIHVAATLTVKMRMVMMEVVGSQAVEKRSAATAEPINQSV